MLTTLGILTVAGGFFLFLWYRTVAGLPAARQPAYVRPSLFKWGFPALSLLIFLMGLYLVALISPWRAAAVVAVATVLAAIFVRFDRHSADMRLIFAHYGRIREANPGMEDIEVLYHTARWRYPERGHDRLVEMVAGKNIKDLTLLMLAQENGINPLVDWELYRSLRAKASRVTGVRE
jgi:hypothetical protein